MNHTEGNFKGVRDTSIYYQGWVPEGNVKAILLIVHGVGEYCGRYTNVINYFVPLGYAVYGLDHIGHGKSDGHRLGVSNVNLKVLPSLSARRKKASGGI
jgi:acylglycerol lipase